MPNDDDDDDDNGRVNAMSFIHSGKKRDMMVSKAIVFIQIISNQIKKNIKTERDYQLHVSTSSWSSTYVHLLLTYSLIIHSSLFLRF